MNKNTKYGQHFLKNTGVADKIVEAARGVMAGQLVEIGPGKGFITERLMALTPRLKVIEIDEEMAAYLTKTFGRKIEITNEDFLSFDMRRLAPAPTTFVSNLPYIDAAQILLKALEWPYFQSAVFMFQREQAERILASAGAKNYGPLSILSQSLALVKSITRVSPGSFNPPPKVESQVLSFTRINSADAKYFRMKDIVKKAFAYKRKSIYNSLLLSGADEAVLNKFKADGRRAQELPIQEYQSL